MSDANPDSGNVPPVERARQEVDRWIDVVRTTGERAMEALGLTGVNRPTTPPVDVIELPEEVIVQIDLPGVSAEMVDLSLAGNMLTVSAKRVRQEFSSDARVHLRERVVGRFHRSIPLPAAIGDEAIRAEARDGLLIVTLRKAMPATGRSIPVSRGSGAGT